MAVTRDDVARRAGVSTAVVSYVLNDGPRAVSPGARERVLAAIAELGYRRDGVARTLAGGRSRTLGLVVPDIGLPYYGRMAQQIAATASDLGYQVLVGASRWNLDDEHRQLRGLSEQRVEGVVLMSVDPEQPRDRLDGIGLPIAIVDRPLFARDGAARLTEHLIEHGRTAIGLLRSSSTLTASRRRTDGWLAALEAAGMEPGPIVETTGDEAGGLRAARELDGCDAVLAEFDLQAVGLLRGLHELGRRCPADVAVAAVDSSMLGRYAVPSITALSQPSADIASEAIGAVLAGGDRGVQLLAHEGFDVVLRESCGCSQRA